MTDRASAAIDRGIVDAAQKIGTTSIKDVRSATLAQEGLAVVNTNRETLVKGREHLTISGTFQSDRYPGCPAGKVPLSVKDPLAQDLLWEYARRHEAAGKHGDSEFPRDLREALLNAGFQNTTAKGETDE